MADLNVSASWGYGEIFVPPYSYLGFGIWYSYLPSQGPRVQEFTPSNHIAPVQVTAPRTHHYTRDYNEHVTTQKCKSNQELSNGARMTKFYRSRMKLSQGKAVMTAELRSLSQIQNSPSLASSIIYIKQSQCAPHITVKCNHENLELTESLQMMQEYRKFTDRA